MQRPNLIDEVFTFAGLIIVSTDLNGIYYLCQIESFVLSQDTTKMNLQRSFQIHRNLP